MVRAFAPGGGGEANAQATGFFFPMVFITAAENTNVMSHNSDHGPKYDDGADVTIFEPLMHSGPVYARIAFHYTGAVKTAMDLRDFPFDSQVCRGRLR